MNLIKKFKNWRDRRFVERIDRVYFKKDERGIRYLDGSLFCNGFVCAKRSDETKERRSEDGVQIYGKD